MPLRFQVGLPGPFVWSPRSRAERDAARGPEPELTHRQKSVVGGLIFLGILASLVSTVFMAGGAWGWLALAVAVAWAGGIWRAKRRQGVGFFDDYPDEDDLAPEDEQDRYYLRGGQDFRAP